MSKQFGRIIEIRAGVPGSPGLSWKAPLGITFEAEMTNSRRANKATVALTNLSPDSIGALEEQGVKVTILAGYEPLSSVAFEGLVIRNGVTTEWSGTSRTTTLHLAHKAGAHAARKSSSYAAKTDVKAIIADLADAMDVGVGNLANLPAKEYATGYVLLGNAAAALDRIAQDIGVEWSIQNDQLMFLARGATLPGTAVLLTPKTGLLGRASRKKNAVEAVSRLNLDLRIGELVKIESKDVNGFFKLQKVRHAGSARGGEFTSTIQAKVVKAN